VPVFSLVTYNTNEFLMNDSLQRLAIKIIEAWTQCGWNVTGKTDRCKAVLLILDSYEVMPENANSVVNHRTVILTASTCHEVNLQMMEVSKQDTQ